MNDTILVIAESTFYNCIGGHFTASCFCLCVLSLIGTTTYTYKFIFQIRLNSISLSFSSSFSQIADFGLSSVFDHNNLLYTYCGSPLYASPEIVNGLPYHGPEVDCWSLGVLLYAMVYKTMPFLGGDFNELRQQISEGDYYEPSNPSGQ